MIYKIFPIQDSTIYSMYPVMNTGLDEIIETSLDVGAFTTPSPQASRFLIQFSNEQIGDVINNKISGSQFQINLKCFNANTTGVNLDTYIDVFPLSQSWNMGTGKFLDSPQTTNGVSWVYKNYEGGEFWISSSLNPNTTSSYSSSVDIGGGTWYDLPTLNGSQSFGYWDNKDINIDVTNIINAWYSASIPNEGFIVKQRSEFIDDESIQPKMKYFSIDTHTIYPPCLEFKWRDYTFNTGSSTNQFISEQPYEVTIGNNAGIYFSGSINQFRVYSKPTYPTRSFQTASINVTNYYLPTSSYYAIKDLDTNEYVIDFDSQYTQLSLDSTSNYFNLDMTGLEPERYYCILIKINTNGNSLVVDNKQYFKIVNG